MLALLLFSWGSYVVAVAATEAFAVAGAVLALDSMDCSWH